MTNITAKEMWGTKAVRTLGSTAIITTHAFTTVDDTTNLENTYVVKLRWRNFAALDPQFSVSDVALPDNTNESTLTPEAIENLILDTYQ